MGNVIYSASPLQAFLASVGTAALHLGLGAIGIVVAVVRCSQNAGTRRATGGAGIFLVLAGSTMIALTMVSKPKGPQTVSAVLDKKRMARDACGDNGETCARHVLEATTGVTAYDFDVPRAPTIGLRRARSTNSRTIQTSACSRAIRPPTRKSTFLRGSRLRTLQPVND